MRIRKKLVGLAAATLIGLSAAAAHAGPIQGSFEFGGAFTPVYTNALGQTSGSSLGSANGIDFLGPWAGNGIFGVTSGSGDFESLGGTIGTIKDFSFAGTGSSSYPLVPLVGFESLAAGTLRFDLEEITVRQQTNDALWLTGTGFFDWASAGFDRTAGTFELRELGGFRTLSFFGGASGSGPVPTPEPASMLLFGTGIATAVGAARRRRRQAAQAAAV